MAKESSVCTSYPDVYRIELELSSLDEIVAIFNEEILQGCCFSNSELALVDYITSVVDPVGWKAVWRSTKSSTFLETEHDFIVEVINVSLDKLEAEVYVKSIINQDSEDSQNWADKIKGESSISVPLIELYVMTEDDEDEIFGKTAIAIEHVRIFLTQIVRPWDDEDDIQYTEELLKSRLQLFIDMQSKTLPRSLVLKVQAILREAKRVQSQLKMLYSEINASDSETEIGEEDLLSSVSLQRRLLKLRAKMEMLENPVIRSFVTKKYIPNKVYKRQPKITPITYVISKHFTSDMIKNLPLDDRCLLEFEHNPEAAFKCCSSGDKIILFPGVYQCDSLGWIEGDVLIQGVGSYEKIVLEATGNSEVLLNCCGGTLELLNLTLRATSGLLGPVVVHHGLLQMKRCCVDASGADIGLLLLGGAEAVLQHTTVCNAKEDGVQLRPLSSLSLKSSCVRSCGRHAIHIDGECSCSPDSFTEMQLEQSRLVDNAQHAIFVSNVPIDDISLRRPSDPEFNILSLFPWLKCKMEECVFENNAGSIIGVSSAFKNENAMSLKTDYAVPEELDYSALSDLLNEVNQSQDSIIT